MKKIIVIFFSVTIAFSFSAVVFAANHATQSAVNITKHLILSEDEPAPAPEPAPEPPPAPDPGPY